MSREVPVFVRIFSAFGGALVGVFCWLGFGMLAAGHSMLLIYIGIVAMLALVIISITRMMRAAKWHDDSTVAFHMGLLLVLLTPLLLLGLCIVRSPKW